MVNIFGTKDTRGEEGPRGPMGIQGERGVQGVRGKKGKVGEQGASGMKDVYDWLGNTTLRDYRKDSEDCCLTIWKTGDDDSSDVEKTAEGGVVKWISRSMSPIFDGKHRFKKNGEIVVGTSAPKLHFVYENGYLEMNKSIFRVADTTLTDAYSSLCVTFKVAETADSEQQYIVSNWEHASSPSPYTTRGITASAKEIWILGSNHCVILHDCTKWTTILIEWGSKLHEEFSGRYTLDAGRTTGKFIATDKGMMFNANVYIGGKSDRSQFFDGCISSVEWYSCSDMPKGKLCLPDSIQHLLIKDQTMPDDDVTPGSAKKANTAV